MQRFYKQAISTPVADGHQVILDDRPVLTPGRSAICVPTASLAAAIAGEWESQGEKIDPETMPLTRIAATALDRAGPERAAVSKAILAYAETDLLCYRAASPEALAERQAAAWQPLLDWATLQFDAPMTVTSAILPVTQPQSSLTALANVVEGMDNFQLAALSSATASSGSLIIGLALVHGRITAVEALDACQIDETFQAEKWGEDVDILKVRDSVAADLDAASRFFTLLA